MSKSVQRLLAGATLICLLAPGGTIQPGIAAGDTPAKGAEGVVDDQLVFRSESKAERAKKLNMKALHRLDFRVTGSSCASCLGRIRRRIDQLKGVYEVAVAIKAPYGVAVIYDSTKTTKEKLMEGGKKGEKLDVQFMDVIDETVVGEPPMILIPRYNSLVKKVTPASETP